MVEEQKLYKCSIIKQTLTTMCPHIVYIQLIMFTIFFLHISYYRVHAFFFFILLLSFHEM